jgi:GNAT superfamily N-acetyltransferase
VSEVREVALEDRHAGKFVPATLIERIDVAYARRADDLWLTFLATELARAKAAGVELAPPQHSNWRWEWMLSIVGNLLSFPSFAIEVGGEPQGLMLLKTDGVFARLPDQSDKPLVEVQYLSAAPWNLGMILARPRFRGVGTILMRAAIETSVDLEFKGRIALRALPQAEGFYDRLGMTCLGRDIDKENLKYYEMTPEQALAFFE